ncbi:hypothetical protein [Taylorella asinigenitalis]|uniref:Uncharacterized protein n=1 Tax=Taylorella asinigenitalis (strain MCE3) TaxID=1008459 RepID=G4QBC7_TAYAM|nr:hypothetical protein [Taylorella asinigenitalis]AEP36748.1 hypothetical protein TASI_0987 [Taylorella asinigenitalis MCE3]
MNEPKSYLSAERKHEILNPKPNMEFLYLCEAYEAIKANDKESFWGWLKKVKLTPGNVKYIKDVYGEEFFDKQGFKY